MKIIAVSGYKGGCAKSVTSIHLARFFADYGRVLLVDSDPNRSCENWYTRRPKDLPFQVVNEKRASRFIPDNDFLILDTPARPTSNELKEISEGSDLTILPCIPDAFSLQALFSLLTDLHPKAVYRCLLTLCPPPPSKEAAAAPPLKTGMSPSFEDKFDAPPASLRRSLKESPSVTSLLKTVWAGLIIRLLDAKFSLYCHYLRF